MTPTNKSGCIRAASAHGWAHSLQYSLCGKRLQVIVKIGHIALTPESPRFALAPPTHALALMPCAPAAHRVRRYDGGVWHVEGMRNEQIVASAIYYWSVRRTAPYGCST